MGATGLHRRHWWRHGANRDTLSAADPAISRNETVDPTQLAYSDKGATGEAISILGMAHSAGSSPFCWCADAKDAVTTTWSNCKIVAALRNHEQSWTAGLAGTLCERYFGRHEPADQSPDDYQSMLRLTGNVTEPSRSGPCPLAAPVLDPRAIVSLVGAPSRTAFGVHGTRFGRRRSDLCRGNIAWWGAPAPGVSSDGRVLRRVCARRQAARLGCFRVASGVLRASTAKLLIP